MAEDFLAVVMFMVIWMFGPCVKGCGNYRVGLCGLKHTVTTY